MENLPLVSIITVNYNGNEITDLFLKSIFEITYKNIEVFVVDNNSAISPDVLKVKYPTINLIKSPNNVGFAAGNNLAIRQSKGKYCFLLNNDTEVMHNFLEPIVELMEGNPNIGIASSKLLYFSKPNTIQYAGHNGINFYTGRGFGVGYMETDLGQYNQSYQTQLGHGAAMLISKKAIEKVGLMAELFFLYYEEIDFCERIKQAGFQIWYCGQSVVFHKESITTGKSSPLKTYYLTRNRLIYTKRNTKGFQHYACIIFFMLVAFPKGASQLILKKEFKLLKAFLRGVFWNFSGKNINKNEGVIYNDF
ncbi:MAG: glycosyltransferase family 2 protein [Candidatus Methylacidiphilales bacterium]